MIEPAIPAQETGLLRRVKIDLRFLAMSLVFIWVAWTTYWDAGLYGDNVEQFIWVHSLEWGYHKHPPMPTWLLGAALQLIGPHSWLTNAMAAACFAATGWLTWLVAHRLFGERIADTAIVLWTLQQCFSLSAQIYNHNTVLVMFMAAVAYTTLRASSADKHAVWWWLSTGSLAACAMLSKYQAALPLCCLLAVVCIANKRSFRSLMGGFASFGVGFVILFSPHAYWAVTHNFPALHYASAAIEAGGLMQRLAWVATFFINQIRMVLPLLLTLGLSFAIHRISNQSSGRPPQKLRHVGQDSLWLWGLLGLPILLVVVGSLLSGSQLRNHWGVQLFQFLPLWVAWKYRRSDALALTILIPVALAIHAVGLTYYAIKQNAPNAVQSERRADSAYPAGAMAHAAQAHWRVQTSCPLKIIGGDFEAGLASAFMKDFPAVYSSAEATPWINLERIRQQGILYVIDMNSPLPRGATAAARWFLNPVAPNTGKYVQFAVTLPATPCN